MTGSSRPRPAQGDAGRCSVVLGGSVWLGWLGDCGRGHRRAGRGQQTHPRPPEVSGPEAERPEDGRAILQQGPYPETCNAVEP